MAEELDLSGEWTGVYNYPVRLPPNGFEALIRESAGQISGVVREPGERFEAPGLFRHSVIEGRREGSRVSFLKMYDDLDRQPLHYSGVVQPGGDEIQGEWMIPGSWSGTFLMVRAGKAEAEEKQDIGAEIRA